MSEKLIIDRTHVSPEDHAEKKIFAVRLQDGKAVEIVCEEEKSTERAESIYIAKVGKIIPNLQAAFLEYAPHTSGYLSLRENKTFLYRSKSPDRPLTAEDEILVQMEKEPMKNKNAVFTSKLCLNGRYAVLLTDTKHILCSRKLTAKQKERLTSLVKTREWSYGFLLRTNAGEASEKALLEELSSLSQKMTQLIGQAPYRPCYSCLYRPMPHYLSMIKGSYVGQVEEIIVSEEDLYEEIQQYLLTEQPEDVKKLVRYDDSRVPLSVVYGFRQIIKEALSKKVWLKSGGYLVIEQTEAFLSIDVNSGKNVRKSSDVQQTFLQTNLEAAKEIARQLRLRNCSGICIVDFVNLKREEDTKELLEVLDRELKKDPVPTKLEGITSLFLVQITRKKVHRPFREQIASGGES